MKIKIFLFLIICNVNICAFSIPQDKVNMTANITDCIINCQFELATKIADSAIAVDQNDPLAPVLKLVTLGMRDVDLEMTVDSASFLSTFELAVDRVALYEKIHGVSSYSKTMLGFSKAIHSSFFLKRKMYMSSFQNGLEAMRILKEAKTLDSTNTDVDFFLGLYDYAKTELKSKFWWGLFWYPGGKKDGIARLTRCSQSACITRSASMLSLADVYISEKNYDMASTVISKLENRFPSSRFVYWAKVKYFESRQMYSQSALLYEKLSNSYATTKDGSFNELFTRFKEAKMYLEAGQTEKVAPICKIILTDPRLKNRSLRKDTERLLEKVNES